MMEVSIFPTLSDQLKSFVEIRLHVDAGEKQEEYEKYWLGFTGAAPILPTYVIVDPDKPFEAVGKYLGADLSGKKFAAVVRQYSG